MRNVLIVCIILVIGIGAFLYTQKEQKPFPNLIGMPSITIAPSISKAQKATYHDQYLSFQYPASWNPKSSTEAMGYELEVIQLNIPGVESDQSAGFSSVPLEKIAPNDIVKTDTLNVNGRQWIKWTRKGAGYVSYDYSTKSPFTTGSFGIHVTLDTENPSLEKELDMLVSTLTFSPSTK